MKEGKYRIKVIIPIATDKYNEDTKKEVESVLAPDFEASYENLKEGTEYIESRFAEYVNTKDIIRIAEEAQKEHFDGIFVDCVGEPGVPVVRELVDIPVIGGFNTAVLTALSIAQNFSMIEPVPSVVPMVEDLARELGVTESMVSIRTVDIPVEDLQDKEKLFQKLFQESQAAILKDGAQSIVLGCTGMLDVAKDLEKELRILGMPAPVIDPTTAAVGSLQSLIRNGLSQSRLTYYKYSEPGADASRLRR
jgi:allantoin racemase